MRAGFDRWIVAVVLPLVLGVSPSLQAQEVHPRLAPFERLVGGHWYMGPDSYHSFSWGVGRQSLRATSFVVTPDSTKRVSELTFMYHPGEDAVKGYGVAIDMGLDFFESTVHFRGDTLAFDLYAYGPAAEDPPLRETWVFTDPDHYTWTLMKPSGGGWETIMDGLFERRPAR